MFLRWTAWMVWALALAPPAGAAESNPAAGHFPGTGREAVPEWTLGKLARAETVVPGRSELPRVAVELDGAFGAAAPGSDGRTDEDANAPAPPGESATGGEDETGVGLPADTDFPPRNPAGAPSSPQEMELPAEAPEADLPQPAPGGMVEESSAPGEPDGPESSGAEFEFPAAPAESGAPEIPAEDVESVESVESVGGIPDANESGDAAPPEDGIVPLVEYADGRITVRADGEPLGDVISAIRAAGGIRIQGLGHRAGDPLSFQVENMDVEDALKRLMRQLKENNYAFEYSRTRLRRLSVFPAGQTEVARPAPVPRPQSGESEEGRERVVRVINVHEGTQAENLDLRQGDLIVEYDGEAVTSAQQLVDAVKARSAEQIVQMTVVRDGNRFPLTLNGGLIGINILTVNVPPEQVGR
jgi:hypothetical protein